MIVMRLNFSEIKTQLIQNWKSGITVSLVSLPLSISLAIAANATPLMGAITAIWAGLFAALFAGSKFNIIGPTGALSGLLAMYALQFGVGILPILAILTGIIVLIFYYFHWEKYLLFIPSSVMHGFTLSVALIIGLNQINSALGLTGLTKYEHFIDNVWESLTHLSATNPTSLIIFFLSLALMFLSLKYLPKIPPAILLAALGISFGAANTWFNWDLDLITIGNSFGGLTPSLWQYEFFNFNQANWQLIVPAFAIALIAIIETLLSAKIADGVTKTKSDQHQEMLSLSLANLASGIFGGIPATATLARTSLNIKSGATSNFSAIINALSIIIITLILLPGFNYLPMAVVAAILVYVAIRMVEIHAFKTLWFFDRKMFWLAIVTAGICVGFDQIYGLLTGATVALLIFANALAKGQGEIMINRKGKLFTRTSSSQINPTEHHGDVIVYRLAGEVTYISSQGHLNTLKKLSGCQTVILGFRNVFYLDLDGLEAVEEMLLHLESKGIKVIITGVKNEILPLLSQAEWFKRRQAENKIFERTSEALRSLGFKV